MNLLTHISSTTNISEFEILSYLNAAPIKYKIYSIPKRNGGSRTIAHPAKQLKDFQRAAISYLEKILPCHQSAFAYVKQRSIKDNALCHKDSKYLLKMDLENFFNSITPKLLDEELNKFGLNFSEGDKKLLSKLLFWSPSRHIHGKLMLSVGAPSSPLISNFILYSFDTQLTQSLASSNIKYSRYADDLTFSTNSKNALFDIPKLVRGVLNNCYKGYISLNESKTIFSSKAHNRFVTGVTLTNDGKISIGRERKRYISALIHKYSKSMLDETEIPHLQGLLSFANHIEPEFGIRMSKKYSSKLISQIMRHNQNA